MMKFSVGDEVVVRFRVKHVHQHDIPPSLTLETVVVNPETDGYPTTLTLCETMVEQPRSKRYGDWVSAYPTPAALEDSSDRPLLVVFAGVVGVAAIVAALFWMGVFS